MDTISTNKDSVKEDEVWNSTNMVKAISMLLSEIISENKNEVTKTKGNLTTAKFLYKKIIF
jgi:hypothetical protein